MVAKYHETKAKKEENKAKFSRLKDECFQGVLSEELWAKGSVLAIAQRVPLTFLQHS